MIDGDKPLYTFVNEKRLPVFNIIVAVLYRLGLNLSIIELIRVYYTLDDFDYLVDCVF